MRLLAAAMAPYSARPCADFVATAWWAHALMVLQRLACDKSYSVVYTDGEVQVDSRTHGPYGSQMLNFSIYQSVSISSVPIQTGPNALNPLNGLNAIFVSWYIGSQNPLLY
jgi:hypothetical protein